jgi:EmrB/QacA subfamily drug resistance transporter
MLLLDLTIVSVALADLQRDLGAGLSELQWVIDAYTLALAGLLLTTATLGDRIGRKRIFATGLVAFTTASLACALAGSALQLDLFRAAQGVGGALLFGTALPLLGAAFPAPSARARAIGVFGATMAAATAVGPLVGGALVSGPGWRWIFAVNVPIGALALLATTRMRESRTAAAQRADWPGAALLTAALLALLTALIRGNDDGWASPVIVGLLVGSAALLAGFVAREARTAEPMLELRLFRDPVFAGVALASFAVFATLVAVSAYLALFLQNGMGISPFGVGLRVLPLTIASFLAAPATAVMTRRTGTSIALVLSLVLVGAGLLASSVLKGTSSWTVLLPGLVLAGLGLGINSVATSAGALTATEPERAGMASGTVSTMRQVGTAAGIAAFGALYQARATERTTELLQRVPLPAPVRAALAHGVGAGGGQAVAARLGAAGASVRTAVATAARTASADALDTLFVVSGIVALLAAAVCAVLLGMGRNRDAGAPVRDPDSSAVVVH